MTAGGQSVYCAPGFGSLSPELRLVGPMRTFSITAVETTVLGGLDVCVCHHSHGNVQQRVAAVSLRDCAVRGSNQSDPRGLDKSDVDQESALRPGMPSSRPR